MAHAVDYGVIQPGADFGAFSGAELLSVATVLKSLHMKHLGFCIEYLNKFPEKRADNILTIWGLKTDLVASISTQTGLAPPKVRRSLSSLALGSRNASHHLGRLTTAIPSLIEISDDSWLRPLSTALEPQSDFAAHELRRSYPKAWSRNVNLREGHFLNDLFGLFRDEKYLRIGPRLLKAGKRIVTDVDATIYDFKCGTLALFQLKWQDVFGWDERERRSKAANFARESHEWMASVRGYLEGLPLGAAAERLGVPHRLVPGVRRIIFFLVGRYATRFTGFDLPSGDDVAIAAWYQFLSARGELIASQSLSSDPLCQLHEKLRQEQQKVPQADFVPMSFEAGGANISVDHFLFKWPAASVT
jgi:hypothetical protein